jgi:hypothetical protein
MWARARMCVCVCVCVCVCARVQVKVDSHQALTLVWRGQDAPFFSVKLGIKVLPCVIMFINGVAVDRIVGFDGLSSKDDFPTTKLEQRLLEGGVISQADGLADDDDAEQLPEHVRRTVTRGQRTTLRSDDEDSDFSD